MVNHLKNNKMKTEIIYKELKDKIENNLVNLNQKLRKHQKDFEQNPTNWGFVGDIEYINNKLDEITDFLK